MIAPMAYVVKEAARAEWYESADDSIVSVSFKAGTVTPKSEREERALKILVDSGLAELSEETPADAE